MANVVDAVSASMGTYVSASADPVKNDASEAFDLLAKMDPARYADRDAFLRKYGVDTAASREGLKREMARHFYTGKIDPGVAAHKREVSVPLSEGQRAEVDRIDKAAAAARVARMEGRVDVDALKALSPSSFDGVDPAQHEAVAADLNKSIGILRESAAQHAMGGGAKLDELAKIAGERKGKQGLVFAHNLDRVDEMAARLKADGHNVITLTGADSTADKARKIREYQAGGHDILVASDAAAVGANLQKGKWCVQADTPQTALVHAQRGARIHRIGQTEDVELIDLVADHAVERRNRDRLAKKYELRSIMTSPLEGLDDTGLAGVLHRIRSGQHEAAQPAFMPAGPEEFHPPEPDQQASMF